MPIKSKSMFGLTFYVYLIVCRHACGCIHALKLTHTISKLGLSMLLPLVIEEPLINK